MGRVIISMVNRNGPVTDVDEAVEERCVPGNNSTLNEDIDSTILQQVWGGGGGGGVPPWPGAAACCSRQ